MRKTPIKHKVHQHKRKGRTIHSYVRGKGTKTLRLAKPTIKRTIHFTGNTQVQERDGLRFLGWLNVQKRREHGAIVPKEIQRIAKKYGWTYTGTVYRGVSWGAWSEKDNSPFGKIKIGKEVMLPSIFESWTTSKKIARMFIISNGGIPPLPRYTMFIYSKDNGRAGVVLKGKVVNALSIQKAMEDLDNSKSQEIYYKATGLPMFGSEGEIIGKVTSAEIVDYIDHRKVTPNGWKKIKEWQDKPYVQGSGEGNVPTIQ